MSERPQVIGGSAQRYITLREQNMRRGHFARSAKVLELAA